MEGSKTNQGSVNLTDFTGEMPPFEEKVKNKPAIYYMNGVEDRITEKKPNVLDPDSLCDQMTVVESIDTVTLDYHENLHFCSSMNAIPAEPFGKLMAIFMWTSDICLDSLKLLDVIPGSNKKSGLVEGIFRYNHSLLPVFIPLQYAEQQQWQARCSGACQPETQIKETQGDTYRPQAWKPRPAIIQHRIPIPNIHAQNNKPCTPQQFD